MPYGQTAYVYFWLWCPLSFKSVSHYVKQLLFSISSRQLEKICLHLWLCLPASTNCWLISSTGEIWPWAYIRCSLMELIMFFSSIIVSLMAEMYDATICHVASLLLTLTDTFSRLNFWSGPWSGGSISCLSYFLLKIEAFVNISVLDASASVNLDRGLNTTRGQLINKH